MPQTVVSVSGPGATALFDVLGGAPAIEAAVELFYAKVMADADLAPFFKNVNMQRLKRMQVHFMTYAFGGPEAYTGRDLYTAHRHLIEKHGLSHRHFDGVKRCLGESLAELGVDKELIARAAAVVEGARAAFNFPSEPTAQPPRCMDAKA